jgi:hypothetical protein
VLDLRRAEGGSRRRALREEHGRVGGAAARRQHAAAALEAARRGQNRVAVVTRITVSIIISAECVVWGDGGTGV